VALTLPADAGEPMSAVLIAGAQVKRHSFPAITRQVSLRNTGTNTLWLSLDNGESWFDVACGTSWDDRVSIWDIWYCTQVGRTRFVVIAVALLSPDPASSSEQLRLARAAVRPSEKRRSILPSRRAKEQR
jgi:hypothetical protein